MSRIEFSLHPFSQPNSRNLPIAINGSISMQNHSISIMFQIIGEIDGLIIPEISQLPSRKDELWNTTCCELFIAKSGDAGYWEYNLSPSHDWAIFKFSNYRTDKINDLSITGLDINTIIDKDSKFELNTLLPLPDKLIGQNLRIGISSVIQNKAGELYYYALRHPGAKPDFHDRNCFTIQINVE